ncbi:thioredoxin domain-containing protein [Agromyces sp. NPDC058064]|uniref:thioredoxin domain-containing protein n=1 Tax=Agromyces sp. NPDC058064 TaxID=3346322 RepID=UPI0036DEE043
MGARLADAVSPYLRAHAGNPVDWFPWGDDAFAEARRRDVPLLISIGYATCHWCHVMARESFGDALTAHELNAHFVAVKVDREEHPDVDASYLAAASAFTRELGWPLTVFATPDGRAFYAGTYFPPLPQRGMPSFRQVLGAVGEAWRDRRGQLEETAAAVATALAAASLAPTGGALPGEQELGAAVAELAADEDRVHGGFGGAPKFPIAPVLGFLAQNAGEGRELARRTLLAMAGSPLRDGIDGGFFRYATRSDWSEPHYERMLTDNALLLDVSVELARGAEAGDADEDDGDAVAAVGRGIVDYLTTTLQLPDGGFASAQDSESLVDGVRTEGGYATADAERRRTLEPPPLDEKVLTGWNGLAIGALARAAPVLGVPDALVAARRSAGYLLAEHVSPDGVVRRASRDGVVSSARAALEDVGMLAGGLIGLALATGDVDHATVARTLIDAALDAAPDATADDDVTAAEPSAVFAVPGGADPVLAERGLALPTDPAEGVAPSGITACATAAWRLWLLGAGDRYREAAERAMRQLAGAALERPIAFGAALELMTRLAAPVVQLVVVVPERDGSGRPRGDDELLRAARAAEASLVVIVTEREAAAFADAGFDLFAGRRLIDGRTAAYRCREFVCALPVTDRAALEGLVP